MKKASPYDRRSPLRTVRKRCAKCRQFSWVRPRERRCKRISRTALGPTGYSCYGALSIEKRVKEAKSVSQQQVDKLRALVSVVSTLDQEVIDAADAIRADAREQLASIETKMKRAITDIKRATTRLTALQRRQQYYARRSAFTPQDVIAKREKRETRKKKKEQVVP